MKQKCNVKDVDLISSTYKTNPKCFIKCLKSRHFLFLFLLIIFILGCSTQAKEQVENIEYDKYLELFKENKDLTTKYN
ncbi:unnamed protein product, partial [marine sediment metagenome]